MDKILTGFKLTAEQAKVLREAVGEDMAEVRDRLTPEQVAILDKVVDQIKEQVNDPESQFALGRASGVAGAENEWVKGFELQAQSLAELIVTNCVYSSIDNVEVDVQARAMAMVTRIAALAMFSTIPPMRAGEAATDEADRVICIQLAKSAQGQLRKFRADPISAPIPTCWRIDE